MLKNKNIEGNKDQNLWTYHQIDNAENLVAGHPRQDMLFKKISKTINKGRILEIGFGDGYLLNKLSKKYECYGADISQKNVEKMSMRNTNVKFSVFKTDGRLSHEDDFFDGFIASEVLEHMNDDELEINIKEIKRILKNGGYAFITFPAEENLKESECYCPNCGEFFHKWGHKQVWDIKKIEDKFKDFKIIIIKEFFTPFKSNNYFENLIGWGMSLTRNLLNIFISVPNKSYLLIIKK